MDDILVYSSTLETHVALLRRVLQLLTECELEVDLSKCSFAQRQIDYLGHKISSAGVATNDNKFKAVHDWPRPKSVHKLREFLG